MQRTGDGGRSWHMNVSFAPLKKRPKKRRKPEQQTHSQQDGQEKNKLDRGPQTKTENAATKQPFRPRPSTQLPTSNMYVHIARPQPADQPDARPHAPSSFCVHQAKLYLLAQYKKICWLKYRPPARLERGSCVRPGWCGTGVRPHSFKLQYLFDLRLTPCT